MTHTTSTPSMLLRLLRNLLRLLPQRVPADSHTHWLDSDASWRASSFELAQGLQVIEHFVVDRLPGTIADTLPAFHEPAPATAAQCR